MAQTKRQIQENLAAAGARPHHRLGQNFMIDGNLVRLVADAGGILPSDLVIEVGPGTGTLTEELLLRGAAVVGIEIDRALIWSLRQRLGAESRFKLIEGDALDGKHALNPELQAAIGAARSQGQIIKLVANLPYQIASPLTVEMLIAGVDLLAVTVQKEVAQRLAAPPDCEDYGPLSIVTQLLGRVEILRTLPSQAFWPRPKIESALIRIVRENRLGEKAVAFSAFIHRVFSSRRKTLRNAMMRAGVEKDLPTGIDPQSRPEEIAPGQFLELFELTQ